MASVSDSQQRNPIDVHVGGRVRAERIRAGFSQDKLGRLIGVRFQQLQKYETGANRISASRLLMISRVLGADVSFFFEGAPAGNGTATAPTPDKLVRDDACKLVRDFAKITDPKLRKRVRLMVAAIAQDAA